MGEVSMSFRELWPGWETVRIMGRGSFGKVYEIRKTDNAGVFSSALKVITIPQSSADYNAYVDDGYDEKSITAIFQSQVDDIVSEFKMMAQFKGTSNIVSYEDHMIVPHEDGPGWDILIRMELLTALPNYYVSQGMNENDVIKLGIDICQALELCGKKQIIHRDIKPQNIFVNEFGDFKLGDFGIARSMDHMTKATKTGTPNYIAPEVNKGEPYDARADIYSLGLVMYWLLNERRLPFQPLPPVTSTAEQNKDALDRRLSGELLPRTKNGDNQLFEIIIKACAWKPEDRYRTPGELHSALSNLRSKPEMGTTNKGELDEDIKKKQKNEPNLHSTNEFFHCEECGAVIPRIAAVCPNCGHAYHTSTMGSKKSGKPKRFCIICGRELPADSKKCPHCFPAGKSTSRHQPKRFALHVVLKSRRETKLVQTVPLAINKRGRTMPMITGWYVPGATEAVRRTRLKESVEINTSLLTSTVCFAAVQEK